MNTGDIVLTTGDSWVSWCIRRGQRLRYRYAHRPYFRLTEDQRRWTNYNHAALVLNADGDLAEALADGVVRTRISKYLPGDYHVVHVNAHPHDQAQILEFAESVLEQKWKYSWATIAGLALVTFGSRVAFSTAGSSICSGFVCDALTRAGVIWPFPAHRMMPADVAAFYEL